MKTFALIRGSDESGVSGIGKVLEGVVFSDGVTAIRWCVEGQRNSTALYESFEHFMAIHVDSHPSNESKIAWSLRPSQIGKANVQQMEEHCQLTNCINKGQKEVGIEIDGEEYYLVLCDECTKKLSEYLDWSVR